MLLLLQLLLQVSHRALHHHQGQRMQQRHQKQLQDCTGMGPWRTRSLQIKNKISSVHRRGRPTRRSRSSLVGSCGVRAAEVDTRRRLSWVPLRRRRRPLHAQSC